LSKQSKRFRVDISNQKQDNSPLKNSSAETYSNEHKTREKQFVAATSVVAAVVLTSLKLVIGIWTGSLGILSEAAHSGLDLVAAVITLFAVRFADRPADKDHHFGHGKIENLSALAETLLLLITCGWIVYEALSRLITGSHHIEVNLYSFAVCIISVIIDYTRSRALYKVANRYNSQALRADALHFQTDIYSSLVVLSGLAFVQFGFPQADAIAAAIVACIVIYISYRLGKSTIDILLDQAPKGISETVTTEVAKISGVEAVQSVRTRQSGAQYFSEIVIGIERKSTFDRVHHIMDSVEEKVRGILPQSDVMVHSEPVVGNDERPIDAVAWIVQRSGLLAHNIFILRNDEALDIDLDIEFPPGTSFSEAHEIASSIEAQFRLSIANVGHVCVHLEEELSCQTDARDASGEEPDLLQRIQSSVERDAEVQSCNSVRCYLTSLGIKISLACSVRRELSLAEVHTVVNRVETHLRTLDPRIEKVFIHAEPTE
jgi:cation diffusion facilitator family transporter